MWLPCKKEGQSVLWPFPAFQVAFCVCLSKETLKCIDYNFAHQSVPVMPGGFNRSKVSLKKLPVRQVVRLLSV
jgi:hypothetical protein